MAGFANILLSGRCNLRCPHCVGRLLGRAGDPTNLDRYPLRGQRRFVEALVAGGVTRVALTGTNTDPLLYRHHLRLLGDLRRRVPGVRISLHTNGMLALARMETINHHDGVCISLPSLHHATCRRMTGSPRALDLATLVRRCGVPLKISTLVTADNAAEIPSLVARCRQLGVRRMVLRKLYRPHGPGQQQGAWQQICDEFAGLARCGEVGGNPVLDAGGMELTLWDFARTRLRCLNLFADGSMGSEYELHKN